MTKSKMFGNKKFYLYDSQFHIDFLKPEEARLKKSGYETAITSTEKGWALWIWHKDLASTLKKTSNKLQKLIRRKS